MKIMFRLASLACVAFLLSGPAAASDREDLRTMLDEFLALLAQTFRKRRIACASVPAPV